MHNNHKNFDFIDYATATTTSDTNLTTSEYFDMTHATSKLKITSMTINGNFVNNLDFTKKNTWAVMFRGIEERGQEMYPVYIAINSDERVVMFKDYKNMNGNSDTWIKYNGNLELRGSDQIC